MAKLTDDLREALELSSRVTSANMADRKLQMRLSAALGCLVDVVRREMEMERALLACGSAQAAKERPLSAGLEQWRARREKIRGRVHNGPE